MTKRQRQRILDEAEEALQWIIPTAEAAGRLYTYANSLKVGGRARTKHFKRFEELRTEQEQLRQTVLKALRLG